MQKKEKTLPSKLSIDSFLSIGKIVSTFGLKGLLKLNPSGDVLSNLKKNNKVYFSKNHFLEIEKLTKHKNIFLACFKEIDSIEKAEQLIGKEIFIPNEQAISYLKKNEFYQFQLINFKPIYRNEILQDYSLTEFIDNPAHPILLFKNSETEILIPYINNFVGKVDIVNKTIEIHNWEDWFVED